MLTAVEGIYENGQVHLLESLPGVEWARVVVTVLPSPRRPSPEEAHRTAADAAFPAMNFESPDAPPIYLTGVIKPAVIDATDSLPKASAVTGAKPLTGDSVVDGYQPRTDLGRRLIALRRAYVENGGKLMTGDEIEAEVRERRDGVQTVAKKNRQK